MKINRRWLLVTSVSTVQFGGLMLAVGWFVTWLDSHFDALIAQSDLAAHSELLGSVGDLTINVATGIGLVLVACCTLLNGWVVARYERRLSRSHTDLELLVQRRTESLLRHRDAIIFGLARLADSRDNETGEHLERIREYCAVLVRQLARSEPTIDANFVHEVPLASTLHDIGKVGIPDAILLKPGPFSPEERAVMQQHATIGADCLAAIQQRLGDDDFIELARQIALAHHERWDGHGYPLGMIGEQIPLAARVVALADTYDALTSRRVYKLALDHANARRAILLESGGQFDPRIVAAFLASEHELRAISETGAGAEPQPVLVEHGIVLNNWPPLELPTPDQAAIAPVEDAEVSTHVRRLVENLSAEGQRQSDSLERLRDQCAACGAADADGRPLADALGNLIQRQVRLSRRLLDIAGKLDLQLPRVERRADALARDELGLLHRVAFENSLIEALRRQADGEPVALLLIDLECPADSSDDGDAQWRLVGAVAQFLSRITRRYDLLGRYDDQTIAVGILGITCEHAGSVAERIRSMLATSRFRTAAGDMQFVAHIGGAVAKSGCCHQLLLTRAHEALSVARLARGADCRIYEVEGLPVGEPALAASGV
ncbi:MAG: HD domain-containing phosphohydrolase [Pirellulales bacterium]